MLDWLAKALLGITTIELKKLRQELTIERTLRQRLELDLAKAQKEWASANGLASRLLAERSELRAKIAKCKCRVN